MVFWEGETEIRPTVSAVTDGGMGGGAVAGAGGDIGGADARGGGDSGGAEGDGGP